MVLTITVVGNGNCNQANGQDNHAVLSSNDLAQLMSGQTVTGLLNPDGSITLNSNLVQGQQLNSIPNSTNVQSGLVSIPTSVSAATCFTGTSNSPVTLGGSPSSNSSMGQYGTRVKYEPMQTNVSTANTVNNAQQAMASMDLNNSNSALQTLNNSQSQPQQQQVGQKKTGQKRLTAKQKQALLQQQQQQEQQLLQNQQQQQLLQQQQHPQSSQQIMTPHSESPTAATSTIGHQPQIVATVQLPNGQIGQLIAPSGGQFWSPNAINLQQLSMAVAAATGTMPQTLSLPVGSTDQASCDQQQQQLNTDSPNIQSTQQHGAMQQHSSQFAFRQSQLGGSDPNTNGSNNSVSNNNSNTNSSNNNFNQQQVMTVQLPNNQLAQVIGRPTQLNQIWSGGPISLSQLTSLAQQGIIQLAPVQGVPTQVATTGGISSGQRIIDYMPQSTAMQGVVNSDSNGQASLSSNSAASAGCDQMASQDMNEPGKWQIVSPSTTQSSTPQLQHNRYHSTSNSSISASSGLNSNINNNNESPYRNISGGSNSVGQLANNSRNNNSKHKNNNSASQNNVSSDSGHSGQSQKKLKRLACTCPNCRDGDNNRSNGDKKKQHICHFPDCTKVYGKTSHLRAHLRWHSGERPYVCSWSFCGKKFTRSDELQRHKRTHTGEKRFQCPECLKRFMRSDHLSKHLKTHIATKKCGQTNQQQQPQANGMLPATVTLPQPNNSIKIEGNMIDGIGLNTIGETVNKQQRSAQSSLDLHGINNSSC